MMLHVLTAACNIIFFFTKSLLFFWHSMQGIIKTPFTVCMKENANLRLWTKSDSMYFFGRFFPQKQKLGKVRQMLFYVYWVFIETNPLQYDHSNIWA